MNFDDYKNDGWGLCQSGFKDLYKLICEHEKDNLSILEFGSGTSTRFFVDVANSKVKNLVIESYDNDIKWCFQNAEDYDFLDLKIRNLVECDDKNFASMFLNKKYDRSLLNVRNIPPTTRQKNCFYDIKEGDLSKEYDIVVLDGPNGNGRSFAFLHLFNILKSGSYVFVDDYTHYPFVGVLKHFFNVELYSENNASLSQQYVIYKILQKNGDS
jgi:hypothetical protein